MPFQTPNNMQPKKNSLVVCAGTVTCSTVSQMGSGFLLFHKLFDKNCSCTNYQGGWRAELQLALDSYFKSKKAMPAYVRIASQNTFIGGVATVPVRAGNTGLNHEQLLNNSERENILKAQYKSAVQQAVLDAKSLQRPLFLQPLGIGVYGWKPKEAAHLFAEAILEADPTDEIDITVPIYQTTPGSNDQIFKEAFIDEMAKKGRNPAIEKKAVVELKKESLESPIDNKQPRALHSEKIKAKSKSDTNKPTPKSDKNILSGIVGTLINNIENKNGGRWTSGANSEKIAQLNAIQESINKQKELSISSKEYQHYLQEIKSICEIKRNPLHFWHTPDSVDEYLDLLKENNIEFTGANNQLKREI